MRKPGATKQLDVTSEEISRTGVRGRCYTTGEMLEFLSAYKRHVGEYPKIGPGRWKGEVVWNAKNFGIALPDQSSYRRRFGSLHAACVAADYWFPTGEPVNTDDLGKWHSQEKLIGDLAAVFLRIGNGPVYGAGGSWHSRMIWAANKLGIKLSDRGTYMRRFGNVRMALDKALDQARNIKADNPEAYRAIELDAYQDSYTNSEILDCLARFYQATKTWPKSGGSKRYRLGTGIASSGAWSDETQEVMRVNKLSLPATNTITSRFGSLHKAFAQAASSVGESPNTNDYGKKYSDSQLLSAMRQIADKIGVDAIRTEGSLWDGTVVRAAQELGISIASPNTYYRRLGGIKKAVVRATSKKV